MIANTPKPPYYAVIFTSLRTAVDEGYGNMADNMVALAEQQPGYLGHESARDGTGITVSYWQKPGSHQQLEKNSDHLMAQRFGRAKWYTIQNPHLPGRT